jgi:TonB family protein
MNGHAPAKLIVEVAPFHSISGNPSENMLRTIYKSAIWGMSLSCGLSNFQQTTPSTVPINGLSFATGHWSGITKGNSQSPWYGFSYVTVASGKLLAIHGLSQDTPLFKLAEGAVATFHPILEENDSESYMSDLQRHIKKYWSPPKVDEKKQVTVSFSIYRNGQISHLRLSKSSGAKAADEAALKAVNSAAPFKPLWPTYKEKSVDVNFTFDYYQLNHLK